MRAWPLLFVALGAGCDGSLASDEFRGTPLAKLSGRLTGDVPDQAPADPHVAILWQRVDVFTEPRLVGELVRISGLGFPATFAVDLYAEPPDTALAGSDMAGGVVAVVDDVDGDGQVMLDGFDGAVAPDRLLGVDYTTILVFARTPVAANAGIENVAAIHDGFQTARFLCHQTGQPEQLRVTAGALEVVIEMDRRGKIVQKSFLDNCLPR